MCDPAESQVQPMMVPTHEREKEVHPLEACNVCSLEGTHEKNDITQTNKRNCPQVKVTD